MKNIAKLLMGVAVALGMMGAFGSTSRAIAGSPSSSTASCAEGFSKAFPQAANYAICAVKDQKGKLLQVQVTGLFEGKIKYAIPCRGGWDIYCYYVKCCNIYGPSREKTVSKL